MPKVQHLGPSLVALVVEWLHVGETSVLKLPRKIGSCFRTRFLLQNKEITCGRLQVIDTPGSNSMQEKLAHNVWIAHALNYAPVSLILNKC